METHQQSICSLLKGRQAHVLDGERTLLFNSNRTRLGRRGLSGTFLCRYRSKVNWRIRPHKRCFEAHTVFPPWVQGEAEREGANPALVRLKQRTFHPVPVLRSL